MNNIRLEIERWLDRNIPAGPTWQKFDDSCPDQFRDVKAPWFASVWQRMIGEKRVAVILSYEGEAHYTWKLFVDGKYRQTLDKVSTDMGSGADAMRAAEEELDLELIELNKQFAGKTVSITHADFSPKDRTGLCKRVHRIESKKRNHFDFELEDNRRFGVHIETRTADSVEGPVAAGVDRNRKITIVS